MGRRERSKMGLIEVRIVNAITDFGSDAQAMTERAFKIGLGIGTLFAVMSVLFGLSILSSGSRSSDLIFAVIGGVIACVCIVFTIPVILADKNLKTSLQELMRWRRRAS